MADCWKDVQSGTLINFVVSCPRGVYFVSSVDATDMIEDALNLFKLLDNVVVEIVEENVLQVINWTPCAVHCIAWMLVGMFV